MFFATPSETVEAIKTEAAKGNVYVRINRKKIIVRVPRLIGGLMPVNFQMSFVATLRDEGDRTIVSGRFRAPTTFYAVYFSTCLLFAAVFVWVTAQTYGTITHILPSLIILAIASCVIVKIYTSISKMLLRKQNNEALVFLDKVARKKDTRPVLLPCLQNKIDI